MQLVLFCYIYLYYKNETKRTEVVDGSNESLYHADEEMHPLLRTFSPSQTIFKNLDVPLAGFEVEINILSITPEEY